jgi:hypothetical protein
MNKNGQKLNEIWLKTELIKIINILEFYLLIEISQKTYGTK